MELHTVHATFHHLGEEKHQMLNLNRRLESYLSRVKLLEEENALLVKDIQALRRSGHGGAVRRKGLEEELRQVRLEVDAAWKDRTHTELEVCRLSEELQALDQQRRMEAQSQVKARRALEQSRKELEEEQRAQLWLREKVSQLEHEMKHLIQTHQEDVANLEATLTQSRVTMPPTLAQRSNQGASVLQLGQEYYQRATRAWQEATEAYQGQLAHLEETLNQTRSRLTQVGQEKSESQLKLKALEKEMSSAQDVRLHLEKAVVQRGHEYDQEVQQLQEHLVALEAERVELAQQMERLVQENHGLMQAKMSLGLEVATYRALLDGESLRCDVSSLNQPRNISDAVFSSQGVKRNYQSHLALSHKTTSIPSLRSKTGAPSPVISTSPVWRRKPAAVTETPKVPTTQSPSVNTPYPKILHDGVFEDFRPQEVQEEVTYAEPLSRPEEQKVHAEATSENKEDEEDWSDVGSPEVVEQVVSSQAECGLGSEPPISAELIQHQRTSPDLTPYHIRMREESHGSSDESDEDVPSETPAEKKEEKLEPHAPSDALPEKVSEDVERVKEETSDSETEAVIEQNFESRTSSPVSEYEPEESMLTKVVDVSRDETRVKDDEVQPRRETRRSFTETCEAGVEDMLYPDGEEMDTWDSVMEKKVDLKTSDGLKEDEEKLQHAEPEEDISTRAQEAEKKESGQDLAVEAPRDDTEVVDMQVDHEGLPAALDLPRNEVDEDEDSQNVSESWRTEPESESYAQDNTLADTRPLIRYKSDETDGNAQAPHVDESESSEGEQEKKAGELGAWAEGKSQRFGTMEDLCEEVEEEVLNEEYELGYTHMEGRDVVLGQTEEAPPMKGTEAAEDVIRDNDERLDEGMEEPTKSVVSAQPDVELETDRLVELELENLDTFSYSAHFAQQQVSQRNLQSKSDEETAEEQNPMLNEHEPEEKINRELTASTAMVDQPSDNLHSPVMDPEVPAEDQEASEKREEVDEHNVSMVTCADETEIPFISRPDLKELGHSEDQNPLMPQTAEQGHLQDEAVLSESEDVVLETSSESGGHLMEAIAECLVAPEPAQWEVPENLSEDFELEHQTHDEDAPEPAESPLHNTGAIFRQEEQPLQMSPDGSPDDIFEVTDSTETLKTNGKDDSLHTFFSSGVQSDFWASSRETGATYRPDDACNEEAQQVNQNLEFADNLLWGDLEKPDVVNWNSQLGVDSTKGLSIQKEQEQVQTGAKQVCRNVVEGEFVHSEESEVEAESWSSGEEPV